jgi:ssDNA-binding replication factor A large subunit
MKHVNLKARVLKVAEPQRVVTRYGEYADVAKALIADETGTINLCLWNDQIGSVSVGETVRITNARTLMFKGERLLSLGTRGALSSAEDFETQTASTVFSSVVKALGARDVSGFL